MKNITLYLDHQTYRRDISWIEQLERSTALWTSELKSSYVLRFNVPDDIAIVLQLKYPAVNIWSI